MSAAFMCNTEVLQLLQAGKLKVSLLTVMSASVCWLGLWQGMNKKAWAGDTTGKTESQGTSFMKVEEKKSLSQFLRSQSLLRLPPNSLAGRVYRTQHVFELRLTFVTRKKKCKIKPERKIDAQTEAERAQAQASERPVTVECLGSFKDVLRTQAKHSQGGSSKTYCPRALTRHMLKFQAPSRKAEGHVACIVQSQQSIAVSRQSFLPAWGAICLLGPQMQPRAEQHCCIHCFAHFSMYRYTRMASLQITHLWYREADSLV